MSTAARPAIPAGRTLVLGGARSGKSGWAEAEVARTVAARTAAGSGGQVTYLATAPDRPEDPEWAERVATHQARRPPAWRTVQTADLAAALRAAGAEEILLVDDLGNWLTRVADAAGAWEDRSALPGLRAAVTELVDAWGGTSATVVAVSNEVGSGVVPASHSGRLFRDEIGRLNSLLAAGAERVVLVVAGLPMWLRGRDGT